MFNYPAYVRSRLSRFIKILTADVSRDLSWRSVGFLFLSLRGADPSWMLCGPEVMLLHTQTLPAGAGRGVAHATQFLDTHCTLRILLALNAHCGVALALLYSNLQQHTEYCINRMKPSISDKHNQEWIVYIPTFHSNGYAL